MRMVKKKLYIQLPILVAGYLLLLSLSGVSNALAAAPIIVDHSCTNINAIPQSAIEAAKANLHIAYGHTSHGSQLTTGMTGLVSFANNGGLGLSLPANIFEWNNGGTGGALDLHDYAMGGDVGYYPQWVNNTRAYLDNPNNADANVIIWSWCGQVDAKYSAGTLDSEYLTPMAQLEADYPHVTFVYMTGHVDIFDDADNKAANQMIRDYCRVNNKVLYDFANIERYDPDDTYYEFVNDNCDYYESAVGARSGNWATEWQNSHTQDVDWYDCSSAHSQPLNANQKAYAAWWLWAKLAGWNTCLPAPSNLVAEGISISWEDNAHQPNEDSIIVQRQVDDGAWVNNYAILPADTTQFTDPDTAEGSTYQYRVVARLNDDGSGLPCDSEPSNVVQCLGSQPDRPKNMAWMPLLLDDN